MPIKMKALVLNDRDNVAVALNDITRNTIVRVKKGHKTLEIRTRQEIPFGHKFAISNVPRGHRIYKYGEIIGKATRQITKGQHVHVHNVESIRGRARQ